MDAMGQRGVSDGFESRSEGQTRNMSFAASMSVASLSRFLSKYMIPTHDV